MSAGTLTKKKVIHYPDSDGQPVADNTLQFAVLSTLKWNIEACLREVPQVFTGGDLLVYAQEGSPEIRVAPDVLVAFGRPRGYRGSYKVWEEGDVFPQVVMEVWSPNNRADAMKLKFDFYEKYGAEEYYIVYPDFPAHVEGWLSDGDHFEKITEINGFISPRLNVRFFVEKGEVTFFGPDGREFYAPDEMVYQRNKLEHEAKEASARAEALAAKLRALGIDPNAR